MSQPRKHMDRRFACPQCHNANIIIHRDSFRIVMEYCCPDCKAKLATGPISQQAA